MKNHRVLICLLTGLLLLAACSGKKSTPATTSENNPPATAPAPATNEAPATPPQTQNQPAQPTPPTPAPTPPKPAVAEKRVPPPPPPKPLVLPAGTVLTVRLQQEVSSKTNHQGDRFEASLAEPVLIEGKTAVPAGAAAAGTITDAKAAGRFKGGASLDLVLNTLNVHGTAYRIQTASLSHTSQGKGKRTAKMVGGGAGAGALIGGIAGGGKGAGIGALVGAGAGTAGSALTGNKNDISLPAEALVSFKLAEPLTLEPGTANAAPKE